jgi:hypothetical protein
MGDFRLRVTVKSGNGEDHAVSVDARKIALRNSISMRNGIFRVDFEQIKLEMGKDLMEELWEVMMYLIDEEKVREAMEEYSEVR